MTRAACLLVASACASSGAPVEVSAEVSEAVPTVVTVRWRTDEETRGRVEFGETAGYGRRTPETPAGTEHEVVLLGLPPTTDVHFRVAGTGDDFVVTTGPPSLDLPGFSVTGDPASWEGYQVLPTAGVGTAVTIVDPSGRIVWWWTGDAEFLPVHAFRAADGTGMVIGLGTALEDDEVRARTRVLRVAWDGRVLQEIPVPDLDHDMVELPDGTIAGLCTVAAEGYEALGDRIVEYHPDGTTTEVWSSWDAFDPETQGAEFLEEEHWTHANALDYDPVEDDYIVGMRNFSTVMRVDRGSGEIVWALGGVADQFEWAEGSDPPEQQHQFDLVDGGIVIFDNGTTERGWSRVVEYALDLDAMEAREVWEYVRDPAVWAYIKGDAHRFGDGTTQAVWSTSGEVQDVGPAGDVRWQLNTVFGHVVLNAERVPDLYLWEDE